MHICALTVTCTVHFIETGCYTPAFDQRAFVKAVGVAAAAITQASIADSQGDPSNPQRFRTHHPPTFTGGGDPMVADHWFMQNEKVLEAVEITSDATRIRLAVFQLEGEAQVWGNGQGPLET